jgi:hypothetical protein
MSFETNSSSKALKKKATPHCLKCLLEAKNLKSNALISVTDDSDSAVPRESTDESVPVKPNTEVPETEEGVAWKQLIWELLGVCIIVPWQFLVDSKWFLKKCTKPDVHGSVCSAIANNRIENEIWSNFARVLDHGNVGVRDKVHTYPVQRVFEGRRPS